MCGTSLFSAGMVDWHLAVKSNSILRYSQICLWNVVGACILKGGTQVQMYAFPGINQFLKSFSLRIIFSNFSCQLFTKQVNDVCHSDSQIVAKQQMDPRDLISLNLFQNPSHAWWLEELSWAVK